MPLCFWTDLWVYANNICRLVLFALKVCSARVCFQEKGLLADAMLYVLGNCFQFTSSPFLPSWINCLKPEYLKLEKYEESGIIFSHMYTFGILIISVYVDDDHHHSRLQTTNHFNVFSRRYKIYCYLSFPDGFKASHSFYSFLHTFPTFSSHDDDTRLLLRQR